MDTRMELMEGSIRTRSFSFLEEITDQLNKLLFTLSRSAPPPGVKLPRDDNGVQQEFRGLFDFNLWFVVALHFLRGEIL